MTILIFISFISTIIALGFLIAFIWAVKSGQYKDDYTPSIRILKDDFKKELPTKKNKTL
jgi:cbb3-type cytochrome oxidase maturation protein